MRSSLITLFSFLLIINLFPSNAKAREFKRMMPEPSIHLMPGGFEPYYKPTGPLDDTLNVRINSDESGEIQNEQQVCINPTNPDNVVAVWRDFRLGYRRIGVGFSLDGGKTWLDDLLPNDNQPRMSDPGLTFNAGGTIYALSLSFNWDEDESGMEVFPSTTGGITWDEPTIALMTMDSTIFEDKELIACDRAPDSPYQGNLYISWTRFIYEPDFLTDCYVIRSTDGNQTWEDPIRISDAPYLQWSVPVVGSGGVVYVAWVSYYFNTIMLDRSFDGGQTWNDDIELTSVSTAQTEINGGITVFSYPAMDADITGSQYNGNLYVAYMDWAGHDFDIYFRKSTDQGETWSEPERINDDDLGNGADQFHPWTYVDENGTITVMFYDRRNDPDNLLYDVYITQSFDGGETWSDNRRVTTVSSDPTQGGYKGGLIGEYSGVAVHNGVANCVWTDFRLGDEDTYGARVDSTYTIGVDDNVVPIPTQPLLISNYPNPFNSSTEIKFNVPHQSEVEITAFDISGRKVEDIAKSKYQPGSYSIRWSPSNLSSGVYLIRLKSSEGINVRKAVFLK